MSFVQLNFNEKILKAIEICGYTTPTPIQSKSIPVIMERKDLVACAQTGTGKTAAFVLPALHRLLTANTDKPAHSAAKPEHSKDRSRERSRDRSRDRGKIKKTSVLILTPTRELANQITETSEKYGKFTPISITNLVGGMPYRQQIQKLSRGTDIIVATPGRLLDHIRERRVNLSNIDMLILDEADRMLDMGFIDDVKTIAELTPESRQTLLFSATIDKQLATVVKQLLKDPTKIDLSQERLDAPKIEQQFHKTNHIHDKNRLLNKIIEDQSMFKAIVFVATKKQADILADELEDKGYKADALHGDLKQQQRTRTVEKLRKGRIQFLVATDVAARGIDIDDVTHVINFDLPRSCEDYVHRIGRTGRAGKSGIAISFVSPADVRQLRTIERYLGKNLLKDAGIEAPVKKKRPFNKAKKTFKAKKSFKPRQFSNDEPRAKRPRRNDKASNS